MSDINHIYIVLGKLRHVFMGIASQYTDKKYESDDAVQMMMLYMMKINPETLKQIYQKDGEKGLIKYGAVAIRRSFTSPRSDYYYTYKKYHRILSDIDSTAKYEYALSDHDTNTWEYFEKIDTELDKLYWYDREVYYSYYSLDGETLDTLAKKTGISRNSLFTTIDNVRKHLKKVLTDE